MRGRGRNRGRTHTATTSVLISSCPLSLLSAGPGVNLTRQRDAADGVRTRRAHTRALTLGAHTVQGCASRGGARARTHTPPRRHRPLPFTQRWHCFPQGNNTNAPQHPLRLADPSTFQRTPCSHARRNTARWVWSTRRCSRNTKAHPAPWQLTVCNPALRTGLARAAPPHYR